MSFRHKNNNWNLINREEIILNYIITSCEFNAEIIEFVVNIKI